jgi:hypothetical protein
MAPARISCPIPPCSDLAMDWKTDSLWFESTQRREIFCVLRSLQTWT